MKEEKGLFKKYWWIPLAAFSVGAGVLLTFFGSKNNPEIKSIDVSQELVQEVNGKDRRIVAQRRPRSGAK